MAQQVKNLSVNIGDTRDVGSIPGARKILWRRNGNPLQYSHLENFTDRASWQATVHSVTESDTTEET